jgi:hypothetical protein
MARNGLKHFLINAQCGNILPLAPLQGGPISLQRARPSHPPTLGAPKRAVSQESTAYLKMRLVWCAAFREHKRLTGHPPASPLRNQLNFFHLAETRQKLRQRFAGADCHNRQAVRMEVLLGRRKNVCFGQRHDPCA